jgi:hypothetical protein
VLSPKVLWTLKNPTGRVENALETSEPEVVAGETES